MKKREFFRQCDLSVGEMIAAYKSERPSYPQCFLLNDLGVIAYDDEFAGHQKQAQEFLISVLKDTNEPFCHRGIAYCYLAYIDEINDQYADQLQAFADQTGSEGMSKIFKMMEGS